MKALIVIACYKKYGDNTIIECVNSIRASNPSMEILIVDSDSEDKSYFENVSNYEKVSVLDVKNKNYDTGAYWCAYRSRKDVDYFFFIQDTVMVANDLTQYLNKEFISLRYFESIRAVGGFYRLRSRLDALKFVAQKFIGKKRKYDGFGFDNQEQMDWVIDKLKGISINVPPVYLSVFGPVLFINKELMRRLEQINVNAIMPENKLQQMAMERVWGICLMRLGIDITNSIQGNHFHADLIANGFEKKFLRRE